MNLVKLMLEATSTCPQERQRSSVEEAAAARGFNGASTMVEEMEKCVKMVERTRETEEIESDRRR